jgi:O-antigen ligase
VDRAAPERVSTPPVALFVLATAAMALPMNLAFNLPPSATVLNQAMAWLAWGPLAWAVFALRSAPAGPSASLQALRLALLLLIAAWVISPICSGLPWSLASSTALTLGATAILVEAGAHAGRDGFVGGRQGAIAMQALCVAIGVAATLGAIVGVIQVYRPEWADTRLIAASSLAGRAVGNLRQPNQLATLLLWGLIALMWVGETGPSSAAPPRRSVALQAATMAFLVFALVLTASRTGVIGLLVLSAWGLVDRSLTRRSRALLVAAPLLYLGLWLLLSAVSGDDAASAFAGADRLRQGMQSRSRLAVWSDALALIRMHSWFGVGAGEFNLAWTLTPFPDRPPEFFDHAHNLPLQLLAELGIPIGGLVLLLLCAAFVLGAREALRSAGEAALARRCLVMVGLVAVLHSLVEYPLWYAHFLFPVAFVSGLCSAPSVPTRVVGGAALTARASPWRVGAAAVFVGGIVIVADYARVVDIFTPSDDAVPLAERIESGRHSWFFAHHADYALVTSTEDPGRVLEAFERPIHYLLDARLMIAWARALYERGETDRARYVAARLAELKTEAGDEFLIDCRTPAASAFQCMPPQRAHELREFRRR